MAVLVVRTGEGTWHQGRSSLSGHRTRLFYRPEGAIAEELWLDRQWEDARAFWSARAVLLRETLDERATNIVAMLARDAQVGARLVKLNPKAFPETDSISVWWSNALDHEDNVHIVLGDRHDPEQEWIGTLSTKDELANRIEALKLAWRASPAP